MKRKQRCTMCGKKFKMHDTFADLNFEKQIGYGSVHDGELFELNLCCKCFDELSNRLEQECVIKVFRK